MATKLPWDITVDILSLLPPDDLLRFRTVCKAWRSLIDGPDFIKLHLTRCTETRIIFGDRKGPTWVDPEALDSPQPLNFMAAEEYGSNFIGSCNGLIAEADLGGFAAIWNPSTRRHMTLPEIAHPPQLKFFQVSLLRFGFDSVNDDYKLVRLIIYRRTPTVQERGVHEVKVYSLRGRAWKRTGDFPGHLDYEEPCVGAHVRGALHWPVMRSSKSGGLLAYDLASEVSREIPMMLCCEDNGGFMNSCLRVGNLGGRVCVVMLGDLNAELSTSETVDVWVMNEYGVKESWAKLCSVGPSGPEDRFHSAIPLMYLKNGDRVLMNRHGQRFVVYDVKKKTIEEVKGPGVPKVYETFVCTRSLVRVDGDDKPIAEKEEEESKKKGGDQKGE